MERGCNNVVSGDGGIHGAAAAASPRPGYGDLLAGQLPLSLRRRVQADDHQELVPITHFYTRIGNDKLIFNTFRVSQLN